MKKLILILMTILLTNNSFAARVDVSQLAQLSEDELQNIEELIGEESLDSLMLGGVSDGGGNRGTSAIMLEFWGAGNSFGLVGVDALSINYINHLASVAYNNNSLADYDQKLLGSFGQTYICVDFKGTAKEANYEIAYRVKTQMAKLIVADQYNYQLVQARTKMYTAKSCSDFHNATLQNIYAYLD